MAGPLGTRAQRHPVYLIPTWTVGRAGPWLGGPGVGVWVPVPPEPGWVVLPVPWGGRGNGGLFKGRLVLGGRCGGLPALGPDITTRPQPYRRPGTAAQTQTPTPRGRQGSLPTEACKQREPRPPFPQGFSERNRPGCPLRGSIFFFFFMEI